MRRTVCSAAGSAALALGIVLGVPGAARAALETTGFRAVGVAHSAYPISALATAPDGRLFAAVQHLGQQPDPDTPTTAEIRVYQSYTTGDGSTLDKGTVWATIADVRTQSGEEGLLGLALAPDFATSKLVYVYLTTTSDNENQHVRVFRENASGVGEYLGTVMDKIEPPGESSNRNGAPLAFGVDGCLYLGVGDNGNQNRWNGQVPIGTDSFDNAESTELCTDVCLGPASYPDRPSDTDGELNHAGKLLRMAVEGASIAQPGAEPPLSNQPFMFGGGLRNPVGLAVHPLTGQLYVSERGDTQASEIDVVDRASNQGWPCLEGGLVSAAGVAACLTGLLPDVVYGNHPDWHRPILTHLGNPAPQIAGIAAYSGLAYPAQFYGDVFYLLRDSARIYRVDLEPPCFLPHPNGVTPVEFHDDVEDGDFIVNYDIDDDGEFENVSLTNLVAITQAPNPQGLPVLYVAGRQGGGSEDDSIIFRIEYATAFTPYAGPAGRVPDSCFTDGVYSGGGSGTPPYAWENPFHRDTCLPPGGPCPGQPNGTPCDDGDTCNGAETCQDGVCNHGTPAADGTECSSADVCRPSGVCQTRRCVAGAAAPDGTPCPDADACNGFETCVGGTCSPGAGPLPLSVQSLRVKREPNGPGSGTMTLKGSFQSQAPIAPHQSDAVTLELSDGGGPVFSALLDHPASDGYWRAKNGRFRYINKGGSAGGLTSVQFRTQGGGRVAFTVKGKHITWTGLDDASMSQRLLVGGQCFAGPLSGCAIDSRRLRCR
jgi:glucose/arabinose dehydrogenase